MRRLAPFYKFTRAMVPWHAAKLLSEPGGRLKQFVRAYTRYREDENQWLPEYLNQSVVIPLPGGDGSHQEFLTGFGLPIEAVSQLLKPGVSFSDTAAKSALGLFGMANPVLKMPVETAFGIQASSGRELADLHSTINDISASMGGGPLMPGVGPLPDQFLQNTQPARYLTTLRTIADAIGGPQGLDIGGRKSLGAAAANLASGARASTVDLDRARSLAIMDRIKTRLRSRYTGSTAREFEHVYVPEDQRDKLTATDQLLYDIYQQVGRQAAKSARERRLEKALQQ
jgi:hypothetical protein